jgi:hypothetical protein
MGGEEVGQCGVIHKGIPKGGGACPPGELPMTSAAASNTNSNVGEECWKTDLDTMGAGSMHPVEDRSLSEAVVAMWKVHRL